MSEPGSTPQPNRKSRLTGLSDFLKSITGVITGVAALIAATGTLAGYFVTRDRSGTTQAATPPAALDESATSFGRGENTQEQTITPAPSESAALDLQLDQRVEGDISRPGKVDRYRLALTAPTRVFPDSQPIDGECGSGAQVDWSLAREGSDAPIFETDFYNGYCYDQRLHSLQAGTYVLSISAPGTTTSRYAFTVRSAPENVRELKLGERAKGALAAPGETERWRVAVDQPTTVIFDAIPNVGDQCGPGSSLSWTLSREGSETPLMSDLFYSTYCYDRENVAFPAPGTYDLVISADGDAIGPYIFRLVPSG